MGYYVIPIAIVAGSCAAAYYSFEAGRDVVESSLKPVHLFPLRAYEKKTTTDERELALRRAPLYKQRAALSGVAGMAAACIVAPLVYAGLSRTVLSAVGTS
jgi:hypothetical protein